MHHKNLVRSSTLAVLGASLPVAIASAGPGGVFTDQASFEGAATGAGLSQSYVETYQEGTPGSAYAFLNSPLTSGVANGTFATGLDAPDLTVSSSLGGYLFVLRPDASYWPNISSTVVGPQGDSEHTIASFGGAGLSAFGTELWGVDSFIGNNFSNMNYVVYDTGGGIITSGSHAADGSSGSYFGVVSPGIAIGSVEFWGDQFGLDTMEFLDNSQGWVPAPSGALALVGFGAMVGVRRRR